MMTKGIFKAKYGDELQGRDWVRKIDPDDLRVLVDAGLQAHRYGKMGGKARARTARRVNGKFVRDDGTYTPLEQQRAEAAAAAPDDEGAMIWNGLDVEQVSDRVSDALDNLSDKYTIVHRGSA